MSDWDIEWEREQISLVIISMCQFRWNEVLCHTQAESLCGREYAQDGTGIKNGYKVVSLLSKIRRTPHWLSSANIIPNKADVTHQKRFHKNNLVPNTLHSQKGLSDRKSNIFYATVCLPTFCSKLGAPFFWGATVAWIFVHLIIITLLLRYSSNSHQSSSTTPNLLKTRHQREEEKCHILKTFFDEEVLSI